MAQIQYHMGSRITQVIDRQGNLREELPAGLYTIKYCAMSNSYYLDMSKDLPASPIKIYGDVKYLGERIMHRWETRNCSTGIGLTGYKGTGKSLLAKELCISAIAQGLPVIMVNEQYHGDDFKQFLSNITQRSVVLFEEFDKVYDRQESKETLLTLLDGIHNSNKLWIFTSNESLPYFFRNRPSRIYYNVDYGSHLNIDIIQQFCNDNLYDTSRTDEIVRLANISNTFNFDMLQSLVSEMNFIKDEPVEDILKILNVETSLGDVYFDMCITSPDNKEVSGLYSINGNIFDYEHLTVHTVSRIERNDYRLRTQVSEDIYSVLTEHMEGLGYDSIRLDDELRKKLKLPTEFQIPTKDIQGNNDGSFMYEVDGFKFKFTKRPQYDYRSI